MSLYTIETKKPDDKEVEPLNPEDVLIAQCVINKKNQNVYWTEETEGDAVTEINCKDGKPEVFIGKNQVYTCLISAPSGSGKSYLANDLVTNIFVSFQPTTLFLLL